MCKREYLYLVTNGVYAGNASGYKDPRRGELEPGAHDWTLLLQIDSDDNAKMMWGDAGMLYVWIRRQGVASREFDKAWTILQCF
ncbi:MAG TPA: YwqG family protein [Candidatus Polarisedimenticolia bacterium]|nr:YwqG family protein [Candidatus Polarisedimenticolia bacterium]